MKPVPHGQIQLVTQPTPTSCMSACIAMVTGLPVNQVIADFDQAYHSRQVLAVEYLRDKGIQARETQQHEGCYPDGLYIATVPSLNIDGGLHAIVCDCRGDGPYQLYDPNQGKEGRRYYVPDHDVPEGDPLAFPVNTMLAGTEILVEDEPANPNLSPVHPEAVPYLMALQGLVTVCDDYLEYQHSGDPYEEDARAMGEMDLDELGRSPRYHEIKQLLARAKGE